MVCLGIERWRRHGEVTGLQQIFFSFSFSSFLVIQPLIHVRTSVTLLHLPSSNDQTSDPIFDLLQTDSSMHKFMLEY